MSKASFTLLRPHHPLKAAATDDIRPMLRHAQICHARHPITREKGVFLATTDSYIAAYCPLRTRGWKGEKPIPVSRKAVKAAVASESRTMTLEKDGRITVDDATFTWPFDEQPVRFDKLVGAVGDPQPCVAGFDPLLLTRLYEALSGIKVKAGGMRPSPVRLTAGAPGKPYVVEVQSKGEFGLLMPRQIAERSKAK